MRLLPLLLNLPVPMMPLRLAFASPLVSWARTPPWTSSSSASCPWCLGLLLLRVELPLPLLCHLLQAVLRLLLDHPLRVVLRLLLLLWDLPLLPRLLLAAPRLLPVLLPLTLAGRALLRLSFSLKMNGSRRPWPAPALSRLRMVRMRSCHLL